MLGAFSVGKTSLVEQYVHSLFSDKYLSTVGVKISKKELCVAGQGIQLILWDMEGQDIYADVNLSYLRGAMGFFLVADGTRAETLGIALTTRKKALEVTGQVPYCLLMNKADLVEQWEVSEDMIADLVPKDLKVFRTSARTNQGVEEAFEFLAGAML